MDLMENDNNIQQIKRAIDSGITPFALTTYRNRERSFGIKTDDRRRHVYIIGKTGMGKTTLIENMVYSDIVAGHGVCYVDPHGDTAEKMLAWIPANRINDVVYFNPADMNFPISFNVLEKVAPEYRHLVSSGLIGVFKKQWADSWGPRLEYILRNAILALLEYPDSTLLGINRILVDKVYRKKVVDKVQDPVVRSFWIDEFTKWNDRVLQEVISPIQNKVGQFLSTALIRNLVGQVKSSIDLRKVMDDGKILILNLSKGRIGEDASGMLGAMMVTKIQLAAMSRVDIHEDQRKDFYLYVDEFQNFVTDAFADILSEARKYHLNLIIAHQYIEQLGEVVKPAVFGNVGTLIVFRVGAEDAEFLEKEFMPDIVQQDLVNLPKFHVYLKLMIDGVSSEPFSAKGLPPIYSESQGNEEKVIRASRERYTQPKEVVEDKIMRWSQLDRDGAGPTIDVSKDRKIGDNPRRADLEKSEGSDKTGRSSAVGSGQTYSANCYNCQVPVDVPFKPDGVRPIFCKDCLKKARRGEIEVKPVAPMPAKEISPEEDTNAVSLATLGKQTVDFKGNPVVARSTSENSPRPEKRPAQTTFRPAVKKAQPKTVAAPKIAPVKPVVSQPVMPSSEPVMPKIIVKPEKQQAVAQVKVVEPLKATESEKAPSQPVKQIDDLLEKAMLAQNQLSANSPQANVGADFLGAQSGEQSVQPGEEIKL